MTQLTPLKTTLLYVMALSHEAKPFCEKLQTKLVVSQYGFKLFHSDTHQVAILVTGSGSNAMSSGIAWSQHYLSGLTALLNVGVVGHGSYAIGTAFLVNKVCDAISGKCFYPHPVVKRSLTLLAGELVTVAKPCRDYRDNLGYDMEASAFFETGRRFLNAEAVQSIKVVSDNAEADFSQVTAQQIKQLMQQHDTLITDYADQLVCQAMPNHVDYDVKLMQTIQSKWRLSVSHQLIIKELLSSAALLESAEQCFPRPEQYKTLKEYIAQAKQWQSSVEPTLTLRSKT